MAHHTLLSSSLLLPPAAPIARGVRSSTCTPRLLHALPTTTSTSATAAASTCTQQSAPRTIAWQPVKPVRSRHFPCASRVPASPTTTPQADLVLELEGIGHKVQVFGVEHTLPQPQIGELEVMHAFV